MIDLICPECAQGKHVNCTKMVLAEEQSVGSHGTVVEIRKRCGCPVCGGR